MRHSSGDLLFVASIAQANASLAPFTYPSRPMAAFTGSGVRAAGEGAVRLVDNSRAYLLHDSRHAGMYERFDLRGKIMQFTVDVSQVACSCNAALYLVAMTHGYCDIQSRGNPCTELDLFEANSHAIQATVHTERGEGGDGSCNQWGCVRARHINSAGSQRLTSVFQG